jgi:hypothetical protein
VHSYLELVAKGFMAEASEFFKNFNDDHQHLHNEELQNLGKILKPEHLQTNEASSLHFFFFVERTRSHGMPISQYAQNRLANKFEICISTFSFQLLNSFLAHHDTKLFIFLCLLNQRVKVRVSGTHPKLQVCCQQVLTGAWALSASSSQADAARDSEGQFDTEKMAAASTCQQLGPSLHCCVLVTFSTDSRPSPW